MAKNSLDNWIEAVRRDWGPLSTSVVANCRRHLEELLLAPASEEWLAALHRDAPASRELYRDPDHGFILQAHTEQASLYRPPHDHGRSWVIYAVQCGESEMGTYARIEGADARPVLVKRNVTWVRRGQAQVYLPGDIHDTKCLAGPSLLFRFSERDLRKEDREEHRLTRYVERDGFWTTTEA
jgi:hypothetical protein